MWGAVAAAQPARVVLPASAPGAVVTAVVETGMPLAEGETATFRVEVAPGVRLFGAAEGAVDAQAGETPAVPLTFAIAGDQPAGPLSVGRLRVARSSGARWEADLITDVQVRHRLRTTLVAEAPIVAPGRSVHLTATAVNEGNAPTVVRWRWEGPVGWRVQADENEASVAPGDTARATVRLVADVRAGVGEMVLVRVVAEAEGDEATAVLPLLVEAGAGDWAELPASVFVGAGTGGAGASVHAAGDVAGRTRLELDASYGLSALLDAGSLDESGRPRLRLGVERPDWRAALGETGQAEIPLLGARLSGVGAEAAWQAPTGEALDATVFVPARRGDARGFVVEGHRAVAAGVMGLTATVARRERLPGLAANYGAGGLTYRFEHARTHRLSVDAGALYVRPSPTAQARVGPALTATYSWAVEGRSVRARLRHVPAAGGDLPPSEASLSGHAVLARRVTGYGWASATRTTRVTGEVAGARAASAGILWMPGRLRAGVSGAVRRLSDRDRETGGATATATLGYQRRVARIDVAAEAGRQSYGNQSLATAALRTTAYLTFGASSVWGSATWQHVATLERTLLVDFGGRMRYRQVEAGLGVSVSATPSRVLGAPWGEVTWAARPGVELVALARAEQAGGPIAAAVGVRRHLGVPVPMRPAGAAYGRVFEDLDGDGVADAGEPGLPGVVVRVGSRQAVTGRDGRWTLRGAADQAQPLIVEATTLPVGLMPVGRVELATAGRTDLAVVRAATVVLDVFEDADGDGLRGTAERGAPRVAASVEDAAGRVRWAEADSNGLISLSGLAPGTHTVTVHVTELGARASSSQVLTLRVPPGSEGRARVPVVPCERRIRFGG